MATNSYEYSLRQYVRARLRAQSALDAPSDARMVLEALALEMIRVADGFVTSNAEVEKVTRVQVRDASSAEASLVPLRALYDALCVMAKSRGGASRFSSSQFATPDDLLASAKGLERELEEPHNAAWAAPLLAQFAPRLAAAMQIYNAATEARKAVQKAAQAREKAEREARVIFVHFRRVVKMTFGARSQEHRELRDRRYAKGAEAEEPEKEEPEPAPKPVA